MKTLVSASIAIGLLIAGASGAQASVALGAPAPNFTLTDMNGKPVSLSQFKGKYVVLEWTQPECPFVRKHYGSGNMQSLQRTYTAKGVVWLSINSSSKGREGYVTEDQARLIAAGQGGAPTDVLLDHSGAVGHLYGATTTPDMYVISPKGELLYMGAIDSIPSHNISDLAAAKNLVAAALNDALAGHSVAIKAAPPYGCSAKYAK